ncbi:MAG: OB-fold nucleic acid binding domain-containing protein, partial [bacterium]
FGLFDGGDGQPKGFVLKPAEPASPTDRLAWEKELLGLYLSGHPLDKYRAILDKQKDNIANMRATYTKDRDVLFAGIIEEIRPILTKKGDPMAFAKVADFTGSMDVVIFPKTLAANKEAFAIDKCLAIMGKLNKRNDELSVLIDKVKILS